MTEIATEDDLYKLFFEKPQKSDYKKQGDGLIWYERLRQILDAKSFGEDGQAKLEIEDEKRFYSLSPGVAATAIVSQRDLRAAARALSNFGGDLAVGYLGTSSSVSVAEGDDVSPAHGST